MSSDPDKTVVPIQSIENENQTLLPQTQTLNGTNDKSFSQQSNNSQYEARFKDTERLTTGKYPVITKSSKGSAKDGSKNGCPKCCTCKCCAITSGVIFGVIVLILIIGGVMWKQRQDAAQEKVSQYKAGSKEWKSKLENGPHNSSSGISGTYELKGYDENYEEYMKAYGIPSFILALIVGKPETLIVTKPDENESFYTMKKITYDGASVDEHKFELNVQHETPYNKGKGSMQTICTAPEKNILECKKNETEKGWKITDRFEFGPLGIINTKTFHTKNIVTKKYYERQGIDISEADHQTGNISDSGMIKVEKSEGSDGENPFGDDDNDDEDDEDEW